MTNKVYTISAWKSVSQGGCYYKLVFDRICGVYSSLDEVRRVLQKQIDRDSSSVYGWYWVSDLVEDGIRRNSGWPTVLTVREWTLNETTHPYMLDKGEAK